MTWKVSSESEPGRYVQYVGGAVTADPVSDDYMRAGAGRPVPVAPMGEVYEPTGASDELGLYLLARQTVPGPHKLTGMIPATPEPTGPDPELAVY